MFHKVLRLVTTCQDSSSGSFQFPPALLTSFQATRNMARTNGMKRKIHKKSTQRTKVAFGLFLSLYKKNIYVCVELWRISLQISTPRHCYPLRNHTEYSTSRFVLLHLNCKTRGHGTERRIYQVYTEYDSLWFHTEIRTAELHFFLFFSEVVSITAKQQLPSLP